ncbi:MAG: CHASE2 domain-containing protein, partial [Candidatus Binatia bacterium]
MSRILKPLLLGLLVAATGLVLSFFQFTHELEEDTGLGLLFKLRGPRPAPADAVVVSIDKDSADQLKIPENPDKWPRSLHAQLVEVLSKAGASVVTFDVHFIEARIEKDDKAFAAALKKAGNVVLGDALSARELSTSNTGGADSPEHSIVKIIKPYAPLADSALATVPFVLPRIPFKVNKYWTFQPSTGDAPSFPVVAFQLYHIDVYQDFVGLLEKVNPNHAAKLPRDVDPIIQKKGIVELMRDIREIF